MELPKNLTRMCPGCASKRKAAIQEKIKDMDLTDLIGKHVKKAFKGEKNEHMWVLISGINEESGTLIGNLDNDPFFCPDLHHGDEVIVHKEDIEDIS